MAGVLHQTEEGEETGVGCLRADAQELRENEEVKMRRNKMIGLISVLCILAVLTVAGCAEQKRTQFAGRLELSSCQVALEEAQKYSGVSNCRCITVGSFSRCTVDAYAQCIPGTERNVEMYDGFCDVRG